MDLIDDLLAKTSRTFALSIPLLPEPTRRQTAIAYLLFRIADTFEDAAEWGSEQKIDALHGFAEMLKNPSLRTLQRQAKAWRLKPPIHHDGYLELLAAGPQILAAFKGLSKAARETIAEHTIRTANGMAEFVARTSESGLLRLADLADLKAYCYTVAGIVGEMLTELFLLGRGDLEPVADYLRERAGRFGEALQLVNILKDAGFDASEGRLYLPEHVDRSDVFALAREDLSVAGEYILALHGNGGPRGLVAFCALPVRLAVAALRRVEDKGPGSKLTRNEVLEIQQQVNQALDRGQAPVSDELR